MLETATAGAAVMYARCQRCDNCRMFNLGAMACATDLVTAWQAVNDIASTSCNECGVSAWEVSLRLGAIRQQRHDVAVAMRLALTTPLVLH